ncbi:unnamed protein product, partial [Medioppia subpectinata]
YGSQQINSVYLCSRSKRACLDLISGHGLANHHLGRSSPGSPPPQPSSALMNELLASIGAANGGRLSPSSMALMSSQLQMHQLFQSHVLSPNQLQSIIQQQLLQHNKLRQLQLEQQQLMQQLHISSQRQYILDRKY